MPRADVVVVGAGVAGLATGRELARRGRRVAVLEQATVGHAAGSSTGGARMRVPAAYPDEEYLERGLRAGEAWQALEREAGEPLLLETGCLSWGEGQPALRDGLARHGLAHAELGGAEVERRFPGLRMPAGVVAILQPDAQTLLADRALTALARSADAAGCALRERVTVTAVEEDGDRAAVASSAGRWTAEHVVVAAGPWAPGLLAPLGLAPEVRVTVQAVSHFAADGDVPQVGLIEYGAPDPYAVWSPAGLKAAEHCAGPEAPPGTPAGADAGALERTRAWVAERYGEDVARRRTRVETCRYTSTEDERFVIERHGRVVVVSACSGHGFQYAPDTAQRAADLID